MRIDMGTVNINQILDIKRRRYSRNIATKALKKGEIAKSDTCHLCKEKKYDIEAHHIDYGRPLDIMWLCKECHGKAHRKNSKLNPNNNPQTPIQFDNKYERVQISLTIPLRNFIHMTEVAKKTGKSLSKLVEGEVLKKYPVQSNQLEFNFEVKNDQSLHEQQPGISSMAKNEILCAKSKPQAIQRLRRDGNFDLFGVDGKFLPILFRHGSDAAGLQLTGSCT